MYNLFSTRAYKSYMNDTLHFMKVYGKNYILNFFIINILFILLNSFVSHYFLGSFREDVMDGNFSKMIFEYGLFVVVYYLFSMTVFAFPPIYARLLLDREDKTVKITINELLKEYKTLFGKIVKFQLYQIVWIILFVISIVICVVTIIGIPALVILIPFFLVWMQFSYYNYLYHEVPLTKSIGVGYRQIKKNFWPIAGSFLGVLFITFILSSVFSFIPSTLEYVSSVTTSNGEYSWVGSITEANNNLLAVVYSNVIKAFFLLIQMTSIVVMFYTQLAKDIKVTNEIDQIGLGDE